FYAMEHREEDGAMQPLLPSCTEIMGWQYTGNWELKYQTKNEAFDYTLPDFYTIGQQTVGYTLSCKGSAGICGATLQPGSLWQIFKIPANHFTNCTIPTELLFSCIKTELPISTYKACTTIEQRLDVLIDFYRWLNEEITFEYSLVDEVLKLIYQHRGCITIKDVCSRMKINERYLERHFK